MAKGAKAVERDDHPGPSARVVRRNVARRDAAAFDRAARHESERGRFAEFIKGLKSKIGEPDPADVEEAMKLWQDT